ncbi:hypothetical protein PR202_ga25296 [Eleusine coracana subsp. coracana]|uniref:Uncharacterized protein n=1 Tax=Eleusine coracana subsp. coracana TaxID=191504 RepID=A0AAV5DBB1_ELECO|nr:hypothetical protein PR202_ga25296 [Eleusine coracana subsp. coracana]
MGRVLMMREEGGRRSGDRGEEAGGGGGRHGRARCNQCDALHGKEGRRFKKGVDWTGFDAVADGLGQGLASRHGRLGRVWTARKRNATDPFGSSGARGTFDGGLMMFPLKRSLIP